MEYRFEFAAQARAEAEAAYEWIARQSPTRAARWYKGLFAKIDTLKTYPGRCPLAPESAAFGEELRQLLYGKRGGVYRILFAIRGEVISVFSIRHSARGFLTPEDVE
jgi:plasmid stabilization system protein ParE